MMISIDLVTWRSVKGPGWSSSDSPSWLSGILASLKPNVFQKLQTLLSSLSQWLEDKVKLLHLASQAWADLCTVLFQCVIPHSSHYQLCELFEIYFLTALIWPLFFAQNTSFLLHLSNCYSSLGNKCHFFSKTFSDPGWGSILRDSNIYCYNSDDTLFFVEFNVCLSYILLYL